MLLVQGAGTGSATAKSPRYDPLFLALLDVTGGATLSRAQRFLISTLLEEAIGCSLTGEDALANFKDAVKGNAQLGPRAVSALRTCGFHL